MTKKLKRNLRRIKNKIQKFYKDNFFYLTLKWLKKKGKLYCMIYAVNNHREENRTIETLDNRTYHMKVVGLYRFSM